MRCIQRTTARDRHFASVDASQSVQMSELPDQNGYGEPRETCTVRRPLTALRVHFHEALAESTSRAKHSSVCRLRREVDVRPMRRQRCGMLLSAYPFPFSNFDLLLVRAYEDKFSLPGLSVPIQLIEETPASTALRLADLCVVTNHGSVVYNQSATFQFNIVVL